MAASTTELILRFSGDSRQLKETIAQVRADLSRMGQSQATISQTANRQIVADAQRTDAAKLKSFQQSINRIAREEQKRIAETVKSANQRLREEQRTAREVARITAETARQAAQQERLRERAAKQLADVQIREAKRAARELERSFGAQQRATASSGSSGLALAGLAGGVTALVGVSAVGAIRQAAAAWVEYSSKLENTRIAFATMLGSADAASAHLKDLQRFALTTPFEFTDLIEASQRMQALGFEAKQVIPVLTDVGNAVAAAGGGSERLDRVVLAISQMQSKGKVATQELNQLAEAGIPGWKILEQQFGKSRAELVKMVEQGKISSTVFLDAFQTFSRQNFGGLMEAQSRTFTGALSNIKDALLQTSATAFEPLFAKISEIAVRVADDLQGKITPELVVNALAAGITEAAGAVGALFVERAVATILDPSKWTPLAQLPRLLDSLFRGFFDSLPDIEDLFGIGDVQLPQIVIPDLKVPLANLKQQQSEVSESARKAAEMVDDLTLKLVFYGQNSEKAATQQKLLAIGMEALTSAEGRRAIQLAELIDKQRIAIELADQQRELTEALAKVTESKYKTAFDSLSAATLNAIAEIRDLNAAEHGGLTAIEKFNFGLGAQIEGMLNTAQASAFTAEQIQILTNQLLSARIAISQLTAAQAQADIKRERKEAGQSLTETLKRQVETLRELQFGAKTARQEVEEFIARFPKWTEAMTEGEEATLRFRASLIDTIRRLREMLELVAEFTPAIAPEGVAIPTRVFDDTSLGLPPPPDLDPWKSVFSELKAVGLDALSSLGQGLGFLTEQWVLLGGQAGISIRKLVASVLAGVAAQAAVLAVMELAYAIAALTPWGAAIYGPAAAHFKSAALFGSIALGAGLLGRAAAGNDFQNNQGAGASGPGGGATAPAPKAPTPVSLDRAIQNQQAIILNVNVKRDAGSIVEVVVDDHRSNGPIRQMILSER